MTIVADTHQNASVVQEGPREPRSKLEWALDYARLGYFVFPLCFPAPDGTCGCGRGHTEKAIGKAPLTHAAHLDATREPTKITAWWDRFPEANIGAAMLASGIVVVDCDGPEGEVEYTLALSSDERGREVRTGKGRHAYYRRPDDFPYGRAIHAGQSQQIDFLAEGYVVLPPSLHRGGATYEWIDGAPVAVAELPPAPEWAAVELRARQDAEPVQSEAVVLVLDFDGDEPPIVLDAPDLAVWRGERPVSTPTGDLDRSESLWAIAKVLASYDVDEPTIAAALKNRDERLGWHKYTGRRDAESEYTRTARKAIDEVAKMPRLVPLGRATPTPATSAEPDDAPALDGFHRTASTGRHGCACWWWTTTRPFETW